MAVLHNVNQDKLSARPVSEATRAVLAYIYAEDKGTIPEASDQSRHCLGGYYDEAISNDSRFSVWVHLSSLRTGLFSWYPFKPGARVLEIGAGFGALTGLLCDKCSYVAATERSAVRAEAIVRRWSDKENLHVFHGEWSELDFGMKFDYIVLTGILERACGGSGERQEYVNYLKKVYSLLDADGILLLAVNNRMGLRYFCGAREPHGGGAFAGINHYPNGTRGYSFSRKELQDIIGKAGFCQTHFYYPLPDYQFPQLIYSDDYLPEQNLSERLIPYYENHNSLVAVEQDLYAEVVENGVFPFFANSFLAECSRRDLNSEVPSAGGLSSASGQHPDCTQDMLSLPVRAVYAAVSTDRGRERAYATVIQNNYTVKKTPLFPEGQENARRLFAQVEELRQHQIPVVKHRLLEDGSLELPFISWPTLSNYIKEIIWQDTEAFVQLVDQLYSYILMSSEQTDASENCLPWKTKESGASPDFGPILKKAYLEMIPLNCFYHPQTGQFLYFDQEFVCENYPAKYILFRAIHYIYCFTPNAERYYPRQKLIERYGMEDTWDIYQEEEKRFLDRVRNHKKYSQFYRWASVSRERIQENVKKLRSEEEVIADYKISDKMKKIWKIELSMLDEVDRICKTHGLTYFLVHGSLLGAVRHKGFIPWDDDLDIAMPRQDYERFLAFAADELPEPLSIHTPETEKDIFWGGFARIRNGRTAGIEARELNHQGNLGIWIDILPLDVCTMDEVQFERKKKQIRRCHRLLLAKIYGKDYKAYFDMRPWKWRAYRLLSSGYSHRRLCRMLDQAMRLYTDKPSEDVAFFGGYYMHRRLNGADFQSVSQLEFEGRKVPVPVGYENYLFMSMGKDYLKYPPEDERKPKHSGIFDPERTYDEYRRLLTGMFNGVQGKKIILFGAGMMFEDYMKKWGGRYRPDFLVDNDTSKWGRQRMGIPVKAPKEILEIPEGKRHIIICSFYYKEIEKQLEAMGVKDYRVYVQHIEWIIRAEGQESR